MNPKHKGTHPTLNEPHNDIHEILMNINKLLCSKKKENTKETYVGFLYGIVQFNFVVKVPSQSSILFMCFFSISPCSFIFKIKFTIYL